MLFTDAQNQFKALEDQALRGQPMALEAGYDVLYADWSKQNEAILPKLSAEERTLSFADYVDAKILEKERDWIEENEKNPTQKKQLLNEAQRGDLILVSADAGHHFNQVLTPEAAKKEDPLKLQILSSTLRTATTNFTEVKEEQNMLHIVKKLREQHFLVSRAYLENHKVHIEATHPRSGEYEVQVSLDQDSMLPYEYEFLNKRGVQKVAETQLPEEYGEAQVESEMTGLDLSRGIDTVSFRSKRDSKNEDRQNKRDAVLATMLPLILSHENASVDMEKMRQQMKSPLLHRNVMGAKASMSARKARQEKQLKGEKERIVQREENYKKNAKKTHDEKVEEEKKSNEARKEAAGLFKKKMAIGSSAAAGLLAGAGGFTFLIAHIAHS